MPTTLTDHSYHAAIDAIIDSLQPANVESATLAAAQTKLDQLAERYQADESLGSERYKLYQAQAMISYRQGDYANARVFIQQAITVRGQTYSLAEQLLAHLQTERPHKPLKWWITLIVAPIPALLLIAILQQLTRGAEAGSVGGTHPSNIAVILVNVFSIIVGLAATLAIMLLPLWIVLLVKAVGYNSVQTGYGLNKLAAILLAVFLGFWAWLYTYERDTAKFWVNLGLTIVTLGIWGIVGWIWAIVDTSSRPDEFYQQYPNY